MRSTELRFEQFHFTDDASRAHWEEIKRQGFHILVPHRPGGARGLTRKEASIRLDHRLPGLEATHRDEVARTVRRVVDKLLHAPTVRIKQLASAPGGDSYAEALRELFELDQTAVDAVATAGELPPIATDSAE